VLETKKCGSVTVFRMGRHFGKRVLYFMALYREGVSPTHIRRRLLGREGLMYWLSNGHFSKQNLVNSILDLPY
jgi:hypothetical protein